MLEVVSAEDPHRDLVQKRREYAQAGLAEYGIVHPGQEQVIVLYQTGMTYGQHGILQRGAQVPSVLLEGCTVPVDAVLDAV